MGILLLGVICVAKFYMEDGSIKSGDKILREYYNNNGMGDCTLCKYYKMFCNMNDHNKKKDDDMYNIWRLEDMYLGDLLHKISKNLLSHDSELDKRCVLDLITGKRHTCYLKTVIDEKTGKETKIKDCDYCIQHWETVEDKL